MGCLQGQGREGRHRARVCWPGPDVQCPPPPPPPPSICAAGMRRRAARSCSSAATASAATATARSRRIRGTGGWWARSGAGRGGARCVHRLHSQHSACQLSGGWRFIAPCVGAAAAIPGCLSPRLTSATGAGWREGVLRGPCNTVVLVRVRVDDMSASHTPPRASPAGACWPRVCSVSWASPWFWCWWTTRACRMATPCSGWSAGRMQRMRMRQVGRGGGEGGGGGGGGESGRAGRGGGGLFMRPTNGLPQPHVVHAHPRLLAPRWITPPPVIAGVCWLDGGPTPVPLEELDSLAAACRLRRLLASGQPGLEDARRWVAAGPGGGVGGGRGGAEAGAAVECTAHGGARGGGSWSSQPSHSTLAACTATLLRAGRRFRDWAAAADSYGASAFVTTPLTFAQRDLGAVMLLAPDQGAIDKYCRKLCTELCLVLAQTLYTQARPLCMGTGMGHSLAALTALCLGLPAWRRARCGTGADRVDLLDRLCACVCPVPCPAAGHR
jgi:hypothetical protein